MRTADPSAQDRRVIGHARPPARGPGVSRRDLIADAVIELLAREGGRGLTHGNIDLLLKLPKGSTSFYFRRRTQLFEAGLRKLVAADLEDLNRVVQPLFERYRGTIPVREVAQCHYLLWQQGSKPRMRKRTLARFEFFLHAARDPQFGRFHTQVRKAIFEFGTRMFARLGAKKPRLAALEFGYLVRGDSMAHLFLRPSGGWHRITPAYYEQCLREVIDKTNQLHAKRQPSPAASEAEGGR